MQDESAEPGRSIAHYRNLYLGAGWLLIAGGVAVMAFPLFGSLAVALFAGLVLVFTGAVEVAHALMVRGAPAIILNLLAGLLSLAIGIFILSNPSAGMELVTVTLACLLAADGIIKIISAAQTRQFPGWGWIVMNGVSSLFLSGLILILFPASSLYVLGIILGLDLLVAGATLLLLAKVERDVQSFISR